MSEKCVCVEIWGMSNPPVYKGKTLNPICPIHGKRALTTKLNVIHGHCVAMDFCDCNWEPICGECIDRFQSIKKASKIE